MTWILQSCHCVCNCICLVCHEEPLSPHYLLHCLGAQGPMSVQPLAIVCFQSLSQNIISEFWSWNFVCSVNPTKKKNIHSLLPHFLSFAFTHDMEYFAMVEGPIYSWHGIFDNVGNKLIRITKCCKFLRKLRANHKFTLNSLSCIQICLFSHYCVHLIFKQYIEGSKRQCWKLEYGVISGPGSVSTHCQPSLQSSSSSTSPG